MSAGVLAVNKHIATYEGFVFTRNSKNRTYTHVVIKRGSAAQDRIRCEANARSAFRMNRSYYASILDGSSSFLQRPSWRTEEQQSFEIERLIAAASQHMDGGEEGYVSRALAQFDARPKRQLADDGDTYYVALSWAGRPDLAVKEANRVGGFAIEAARANGGQPS